MASSRVIGMFKTPLPFFLGRTENFSVPTVIYWIFRIGVAMNFIAHGTWGLVGREAWLPYFEVANIGPEAAFPLMWQIGLADVTAGVMMLLLPLRSLLLYMVIWGLWTAVLRPLSGDPWWHWMERAGNYGVPLALLIFLGFGQDIKDWFSKVEMPDLTEEKIKVIKWILRLTIAAFLIAHGGFGALDGKVYLIGHWASVGLPGPLMDPETFLFSVGVFEMALGTLVLIRPMPPILLFVMFWKIFTELLYFTSGLPLSEHPPYFNILSTIERGGMFAAPLALFVLMVYRSSPGGMETAPSSPGEGRVGGLRKIANWVNP